LNISHLGFNVGLKSAYARQTRVSGWHEMIGDPTLADAILDRLVHNAHKIELKGESMRKTLKSLTQSGHSGT
jgi:DNA replication protein DnaC